MHLSFRYTERLCHATGTERSAQNLSAARPAAAPPRAGQNQGYNANGESYNAMWIPIFLVCAAFFLAWAIGQALIDDYDMIGVPDEVL